MNRRRGKHNNDLPSYLYFDKSAGYRFTIIDKDGKPRRVSLGRDRRKAINVALEYNRIARPELTTGLDRLIAMSQPTPKESAPFADRLDYILERILEEERPARDTEHTLRTDIARCKSFFKNIPTESIALETVNEYLREHHSNASNQVYNRKISMLKKLFSYAMDEGWMFDNPAELKKKKPKEAKQRQRLSLDAYKRIYAHAERWLKTAMALSLQTTHARLEVTRIEYKLKCPQENRCGCVWFETPKNIQGARLYGTLYIHRQKVEKYEASHVAIPIGDALKQIIDDSRDITLSDFVVHRLPKRCNKLSSEVRHLSQVAPDYLSRAFSKARDELGLYNDLPLKSRPSFHEIRALSAYLHEKNGINPSARMAHTDEETKKIYTRNHEQWIEVPHSEVAV